MSLTQYSQTEYDDNKILKGRKKHSSTINQDISEDKAEQYNKCKKRPWTEEEDKLVIKLVEENGAHKWTVIATHLPGRIGKQCRERWHNHLNPNIKKTPWSEEEEWVLYLFHRAIGNKWAEIAKNIDGRTDNSIKNHWNSGMKRRIIELADRLVQVQNQFKREGISYFDVITNATEKKALEIILLNKKYEEIDDGSDSDDSTMTSCTISRSDRELERESNSVFDAPSQQQIKGLSLQMKKKNKTKQLQSSQISSINSTTQAKTQVNTQKIEMKQQQSQIKTQSIDPQTRYNFYNQQSQENIGVYDQQQNYQYFYQKKSEKSQQQGDQQEQQKPQLQDFVDPLEKCIQQIYVKQNEQLNQQTNTFLSTPPFEQDQMELEKEGIDEEKLISPFIAEKINQQPIRGLRNNEYYYPYANNGNFMSLENSTQKPYKISTVLMEISPNPNLMKYDSPSKMLNLCGSEKDSTNKNQMQLLKTHSSGKVFRMTFNKENENLLNILPMNLNSYYGYEDKSNYQ